MRGPCTRSGQHPDARFSSLSGHRDALYSTVRADRRSIALSGRRETLCPTIAQLVRGLANVLGVDHVALELAGHVDLAFHGPSETDVDVDAPILFDGWRTNR